MPKVVLLGTVVVDPEPVAPTRRPVDNDDYAAFAARIIAAQARRVAKGDIDAVADMARLADELDYRTRVAIHGLLDKGYSWTDVGRALGISRQGARQRWMRKP